MRNLRNLVTSVLAYYTWRRNSKNRSDICNKTKYEIYTYHRRFPLRLFLAKKKKNLNEKFSKMCYSEFIVGFATYVCMYLYKNQHTQHKWCVLLFRGIPNSCMNLIKSCICRFCCYPKRPRLYEPKWG